MSDPLLQIRTIRVEAARAGAAELDVTGRLLDERPGGWGPGWLDARRGSTIHDMTLTLRVRYPDFVITAVGGTMAAHPYTLCPDALPPLQQLVGISVARGFLRAINERFGRQRGCAHLTALLQAIAPVVRQGAGVAFYAPTARPGGQDHWFVDSCQAWRAGGPLATRLEAGDVDGMRGFAAPDPR